MNANDMATAIRKRKVMENWLNNPFASYEEISKMSNISKRTFERYRADAAFMAEYHQRQNERFKSLEGKAVALLEQQMEQGNWNAIKYTLDGSGYKPTDKVEVQQTTITVSIEDDEDVGD